MTDSPLADSTIRDPLPPAGTRRMLVVSHTGRRESLEAATAVISRLVESDVTPVLLESERLDLTEFAPDLGHELESFADIAAEDLELVIVLGGDGTILRAAELVRGTAVPLLGVNLGHVGFLAEAERDDLGETLRRALDRDYVVEERMTIDVRVVLAGEVVYESWALNEATVEKASRERMLELVIEVGGRPLSAFGCDGAVIATPTGSTAYAFSAGGPVVWPNIDAMLLVPLAAHALFSRPLVIAPTSMIAIEVQRRTDGIGVLFCDGRRSHDLAPGARVEVTRSSTPVRLARLQRGAFTDRLVRKFDLPVTGWRGPVEK